MRFCFDIWEKLIYSSIMKIQPDQTIIETIKSFRLPKYAELPNVGLYLEQTARYINGFLARLSYTEITGSMIRNYVKMGLIANPDHKQYYADQIAHLIVTSVLKNVISLENISMLFSIQKQAYAPQVAYDYFCMELENMVHFQFGIKNTMDRVGVTSSFEKKMLRSAIIAVSNIIYLNVCFQDLKIKIRAEELEREE